ncbi:MAG: hypothetical protein AAFO04_19440 [Cyanobacteria bacterium J06592_8]
MTEQNNSDKNELNNADIVPQVLSSKAFSGSIDSLSVLLTPDQKMAAMSDIVKSKAIVEEVAIVAQAASEIVAVVAEYGKLLESEKTNRREIERKEKETVTKIRTISDLIKNLVQEEYELRNQTIQACLQIITSLNQEINKALNEVVDEAKVDRIIATNQELYRSILSEMTKLLKNPPKIDYSSIERSGYTPEN